MDAGATGKLIFLAIAGIVGVFGARRLMRANLSKGFSSTEAFEGKLYDCRVQGIQCGSYWRHSDGRIFSVGADKRGIYMRRPANAPPLTLMEMGWNARYYAPLEQPLFIPWENLLYRNTAILFFKYVRFDVPSIKAVFLIPRKIADRLLIDAGHEKH